MPDESQADVSSHGFWKWGTSALFDMRIVSLDASSYMRQTSTKDLATAEKEKKENYFQICLELKCSFASMVYSIDGIPRMDDLAAQRRLALLLSNKLKQEYSYM